jgi:hypothetical protein
MVGTSSMFSVIFFLIFILSFLSRENFVCVGASLLLAIDCMGFAMSDVIGVLREAGDRIMP